MDSLTIGRMLSRRRNTTCDESRERRDRGITAKAGIFLIRLMGGFFFSSSSFFSFHLFHLFRKLECASRKFLKEKEKGPTLRLISVSLLTFDQPTRQMARSLSTLSKNRCLSVMWETGSITLLVCQRLLFLCFGQFWDFIGVWRAVV